MVFQKFNLFPLKTVLENITYAPIKLNKMDKQIAKERGMDLHFIREIQELLPSLVDGIWVVLYITVLGFLFD